MSAVRRDAVRQAVMLGKSHAEIASYFSTHYLLRETSDVDRVGVEWARSVQDDYRKTIARDIAHSRRHLVLFLHEEGFTLAKIAERLGCRESTVRRELDWWDVIPQQDVPAGVVDLASYRTRRGQR